MQLSNGQWRICSIHAKDKNGNSLHVLYNEYESAPSLDLIINYNSAQQEKSEPVNITNLDKELTLNKTVSIFEWK